MKKFGLAALFFILGFIACIVTLFFSAPYIPKKKSYSTEFASMEKIKSNCSSALERELKEGLDFHEVQIDKDENLKSECLNRLEDALKRKYAFTTELLYFVDKTGSPMIEKVHFDLYLPKKIKVLDESREISVDFANFIIEFINECSELQPYLIEKPFEAKNLILGIDYDSRYPRGDAGFVGSHMIYGDMYHTWEYKPGLYPPESYEEAKQKVLEGKNK